MTSTTHPVESTPATLYVALELSTKEWWLTMSPTPRARPRRVRVRVGDREGLTRALDAARRHFGLAADAPVVSCYEAGRDGFWPHRLLTALGVTNLVVDSSSIEVSRRARRSRRTGSTARSCCDCCCAMGAGSATCGMSCRCRPERWKMRAMPVGPARRCR